MEPLLIKSCSVDKPGVLTLRGYPNERQPWTPTPRVSIDVHTICWYQIDDDENTYIHPATGHRRCRACAIDRRIAA